MWNTGFLGVVHRHGYLEKKTQNIIKQASARQSMQSKWLFCQSFNFLFISRIGVSACTSSSMFKPLTCCTWSCSVSMELGIHGWPSKSGRAFFSSPNFLETWKRLRRRIKIDKDCTGEYFGYSHGVIVVKCWKHEAFKIILKSTIWIQSDLSLFKQN